jgi:uncharacterized membrane protein (DUF441 family)
MAKIRLRTRFLIASMAALTVLSIAIAVAWLGARGDYPEEQSSTWHRLGFLNHAIHKFHDDTGNWPSSLQELADKRYESESDLVDRWGRPFLYTVDGNSLELLSLGRDGEPGGIGVDADLSGWSAVPDSPPGRVIFPPEASVTFRQFLFSKQKTIPFYICLLGVTLAVFVSMLCLRDMDLEAHKRREVAAAIVLGVMFVVASVTAGLISVLHLIPSGH